MDKSNRNRELIHGMEFMGLVVGSGVVENMGELEWEEENAWEGALVEERRNPNNGWDFGMIYV